MGATPSDSGQGPVGWREGLSLAGWVGALAACGVALYFAFGWPHSPDPWPDWPRMAGVLGSSEVPTGRIVYVLGSGAWLLWAYLVLTTLSRLAVVIVLAASRGGALGKRLLAVSDGLTLPIVRRLVDGLVVTLTVARLLGPMVPIAHAMATERTTIVREVGRDGQWASDSGASGQVSNGRPRHAMSAHVATSARQPAGPRQAASSQRAEGREIVYVVKAGDTLSGIAARFLGDEARWSEIWSANRGRLMWPGVRFADPNLIRPGWELKIPLGEHNHHDVHTVVEGESLWSIAESDLRDGERWGEIWELNEGRVMADGEGFADPRLIRPGWQLLIPRPVPEVVAEATVEEPIRPAESRPADPRPDATTTPERTPVPMPTVAPVPTTQSTDIPVSPSATPVPLAERSPVDAVITLPDGRLVAVTFAAALLGLAAVVARRNRDSTFGNAFGQGDQAPGSLAAALRQRVDARIETDKVAIVTNRLWTILADWGLAETMLLTCLEGRDSLVYACRGPRARIERIAEKTLEIGEELGCKARALVGARGSLTLTLTKIPYRQMIDSSDPDYHHHAPLLVPLGVQDDGQVLHLNLARSGATVALSPLDDGAAVLLRTLVVTLAAQAHYRQLRMVLVGKVLGAFGGLDQLPHLARPIARTDDASAVGEALDYLRGELARRIGLLGGASVETIEEYNRPGGDVGDERREYLPFMVVGIDDLGELLAFDGAAGQVATLCREGPRYGFVLLAAETERAGVADGILADFPTRLAFRQADPGASVRPPGQAAAETLTGEGDFLLGRAGETATVLHGFRLTPEDAKECVRIMAALRRGESAGPAPDDEAAIANSSPTEPIPDGSAGDADGSSNQVTATDEPQTYGDSASEAAEFEPSSSPASEDESSGPGDPAASGEPPASVGTGQHGEASIPQTGDRTPDTNGISSAVLGGAPLPGVVAANGHGTPAARGTSPEHEAAGASASASGASPVAGASSDGHSGGDPRTAAAGGQPATDAAETPHTADAFPGGTKAGDAVIRICCLGRFRVFRGDFELTHPPGTEEDAEGTSSERIGQPASHPKTAFRQKARELLAYFAAYPQLDLSRDRIQESLWPDEDGEKSARAFRQNLWILRAHLAGASGKHAEESGFISQQGGVYRLDTGRFWIDSQEFQRLVAKSDRLERSSPEEAAACRDRAINLYKGDFLQHTYYDWASGERDRLKALCLRTLGRQIRYYNEQHDSQRSIELVLKALGLDPLSERLHRQLMQLYADTGNWQSLARHYEALRATIHGELDAEPEAATRELYERLIARRKPAIPDG